MRIFAHLVVKDEADRFLDACLAWHESVFDGIHIYDDLSSDNTLEIAKRYTEFVGGRVEGEPSFMDHEGKFRQVAWDDLTTRCGLEKGDWVFCFDADEFLVAKDGGRKALETLVDFAENTKKNSAAIMRPEVWDASGYLPQVRVDGFWAQDRPVRFAKWKPKGVFKDAKLGCGSLPSYAYTGTIENLYVCNLLHYGYSIEGEAQRKHDLYGEVSGNFHNPQHIASLLQTPILKEWMSDAPEVWRGDHG